MSGIDEVRPGATIAGWDVVASIREGSAPRFRVERDQRQATLTLFATGGPAGRRHQELAKRIKSWQGKVRSPHVHPVGVGEIEGGLFVIVPDDLDRPDGEPLAPAQALQVIADAARGLAAFHAAGLSHGELDPWSVVNSGGESAQVLPPGLRQGPAELITLGLDVDPRYASPEVLDQQPPSPPSDVFSLGMVLYRLLSGHPPAKAPDPVSAFVARGKSPVPDLAKARGGLPAPVLELYQRLCSPYPERPQNGTEALALIERAAKGRSLPAPKHDSSRVTPVSIVPALAALFLGVTLLGGGLYVLENVIGVQDPLSGFNLAEPTDDRSAGGSAGGSARGSADEPGRDGDDDGSDGPQDSPEDE